MQHIGKFKGNYQTISNAGVWLQVGKPGKYTLVDADGQANAVEFKNYTGLGNVAFIGTDRLITKAKDKDELQLWHATQGVLATAAVGPRAPSPFAMDQGRLLWDGWWLTNDESLLWYAGYEDLEACLYVFDATSLELLDKTKPTSILGYPKPDEPYEIGNWGDFAASTFHAFNSQQPVGMFGSCGDSFGYLALYRFDGGLQSLVDEELELTVSHTSDEVVWFIAMSPDNKALVCCDDLGFFTRVELDTAERPVRHVRPLEAVAKDDRIELEGFESQPVLHVFEPREVERSESLIWVQMEVNEYAMDDDLETVGDVPETIFVALDNDLKTSTVVAESALKYGMLLPGGLVAVAAGPQTELYRLA